MSKSSIKKVDVQAILKEKNPGLYKMLPGIFVNYLEKVVHQDEVNKIITTHGHKKSIDFLNSVLDEFKITGTIKGAENLPQNSKFILAANHPLGSMDGLLLIKILYERYGKAKSLVNDMLMNLEPLKDFFIGFNILGSGTAREVIKELNSVLKSDVPILYFPSGMVCRRYKGKIMEPEWKKTFITNAVRNNRPIVPAFVDGRLSNKFYRIAGVRRFWGIKANIEMLYLSDEMFKLKEPKLTVTIGKPIAPEVFDKSLNYIEWADKLRLHTYMLKNNPNAEF